MPIYKLQGIRKHARVREDKERALVRLVHSLPPLVAAGQLADASPKLA
jgi:hypothetical protein